jgi:hypothetical protein
MLRRTQCFKVAHQSLCSRFTDQTNPSKLMSVKRDRSTNETFLHWLRLTVWFSPI